ncbi:VanZ family protein [Methanosarcina sp.]|uniref:VanZ family protein n=1 Tax=Methanosarcina sp. TaxID=2213 RepID=UPI003C75DE2F
MLKVKNSRVIVPATVLYAVFVFYLSVISNIGDLKHLIGITLGDATAESLTAAHVSVFLKFLVGSLNFVERQTLDFGHMGIYFGFGILVYFAFLSSRNQTLGKYAAACAVLTSGIYDIMNEFFQNYFPNLRQAWQMLSQTCRGLSLGRYV